MSWDLPQEDFNLDAIDTKVPDAPMPMEQTVLVDLATESEAPKTYAHQDGEKLHDKRKREGVTSYAPAVDIYEPGFRTDVYEGLMQFFKERRETKDRLDRLREKIGLRR